MAGLSDKQELFCREYLKDFNATQAAIRAGYSPDSARQQASRMLTYDNVSERIESLSKALLEQIDEDILDNLKTLREIREQGEKDSDRIKSVELLMRYHGSFEKDNTQKSGNIQFIIQPEGEEPEIHG
jgi:phage terminase small subunit